MPGGERSARSVATCAVCPRLRARTRSETTSPLSPGLRRGNATASKSQRTSPPLRVQSSAGRQSPGAAMSRGGGAWLPSQAGSKRTRQAPL